LLLALLCQSDGIVPQIIQKLEADPGQMALALLRGEFTEGDTVQVEASDGHIVFDTQR
jgi:hypothetical protein